MGALAVGAGAAMGHGGVLLAAVFAQGNGGDAYIIPCDIWCDRNPFHRHELYSWYMVSDLVDNESKQRGMGG